MNKKIVTLFEILLILVSLFLTAYILFGLVFVNSEPKSEGAETPVSLGVMDRFDMQMNNILSDALNGVLSITNMYLKLKY